MHRPTLAESRPDLAAEYIDTERSADSVTLGTGYAARWRCVTCAHEWEAPVKNRVKGSGCPACAGKVVVAGQNDLATTHPHLTEEWDASNMLLPTEVSKGSTKKYVWACVACNYRWEASVNSRTNRSSGCPRCAGHVLEKGVNDLSFVRPDIAAEWVVTEDGRTPDTVMVSSDYRATWQCAKGHQWVKRVADRTAGKGCPVCANKECRPGVNSLADTRPDLLVLWSEKNTASPGSITAGSKTAVWWKCARGHEWEAEAHTVAAGHRCLRCARTTFVSKFEDEVHEYLASVYTGRIERTYHGFRKQGVTELDLYFPGLEMAVECHGVYWHSEAGGRGPDAHAQKYRACQDAGVRLIQVWEDDWMHRRDIVKRMLAHKLGVSQEPVVAARKTTAEAITTDEARVFLDANHIQGWVRGSLYLGLRYGEELVAVMVLTYSKTETRLERYATSARVPGGQSKLLAYAERTRPWARLITFADHEVSDGNLYERTGWTAEKVLRPDYRYVVGGRRAHKFGYRLARFRSDPNLEYVDGLSERELAALNKLHRVWDSGKTRYVKTA